MDLDADKKRRKKCTNIQYIMIKNEEVINRMHVQIFRHSIVLQLNEAAPVLFEIKRLMPFRRKYETSKSEDNAFYNCFCV